MSILSLVADAAGIGLSYVIAMGVSIALAAGAAVFSRRRIPSPERLWPGERPEVLLSIAGVGLMAWGAVAFSLAASQAKEPSQARIALANGLAQLAALIGLMAATAGLRPHGFRSLGLTLRRLPAGLLAGVAGILIVLPWMFWAEAATQRLWTALHWQHGVAHELLIVLGQTPSVWLRAAIVVTAVAVGPLAEEMFFRGQLQTFVRYWCGRAWLAVLVGALAFACVHPWWMWPPIFLLGVCLGYAYERTGNLWANVMMHSLFNLTSIAIYAHGLRG